MGGDEKTRDENVIETETKRFRETKEKRHRDRETTHKE